MVRGRAALLLFFVCSTKLALSSDSQGFQHSASFGSSNFASKSLSNGQAPIVQTKTTYKGCSSSTGCGGVTLENGQVTHEYGNPAAIGISGTSAAGLDPVELHTKFAQQASDINSAFAANLPSDGPFWWAAPNSPFKDAQEAYMKWIKDGFSGIQLPNACAVCALSNANKANGGGTTNSIDSMIQRNPFLNGQFSSSISGGSTGSGGFTSSGSKDVDISKNPFLNGEIQLPVFPTHSTSAVHATTNGFQQSTFGSTGGANINIANNPFLNGAITNTGCNGAGGGCGQKDKTQINIANNPFLNGAVSGCSGSNGCGQPTPTTGTNINLSTNPFLSGTVSNQGQTQFTQQSGCTGPFCGQQQEQTFPKPTQPSAIQNNNLPHPPGATTGNFRGETGNVDGVLTLSCTGKGYICIKKHLCINGYVNDNGEGIIQSRGPSEPSCKASSEVCCRIKPSSDNQISVTGNLVDSAALQSSLSANFVQTADSASSVNFIPPGVQFTSGIQFVPNTKDQLTVNFDESQYEQNNNFGQSAFGQTAPGQGGFNQVGFGQTGFGQSTIGQPNAIQTSFTARPGSPAGLKPGIPYLPPVEQPKITTQRPTPYVPPYKPPTTPKPTPYVPPYQPPSTRPTPYVPPYQPTTPKPTPYVPPYQPTTPKPTPYVPPYQPPTQKPTPYQPPTQRPTTYIPPRITTTPPPYLPPKEDERPQSSIGSQQIVPGPRPDSEGSILLDNTRLPPAQNIPLIPTACAAALKCTPIEYCTADGVISNTTVLLTKEQQEYRVPMTDCREPTTGVVGKCCRDPTYTDPWPTNQLGLWVPGAFGDTGEYRDQSNRNKPTQRPILSGGGINLGAVRPAGSVNTPIFTSNPNKPNIPTNNFNGFQNVKNPTKNPVKNPIKQTNNYFPNPTVSGQITANNPSYTTGQLQLSNFQNGNAGLAGNSQFSGGSQFSGNSQFGGSSQFTGNSGFSSLFGGSGSCGIRRPGRPAGNKDKFEADFGEIPWQAMILLQTNKSLLCGGVITAPDVVVTSAHCVDGFKAKDVSIKGGEYKLGVDDEPKTFQIVQVSKIINHPAYQPGNLQYDIAVLLLAEKLRFAEHISPICLPPSGQSDQRLYNGQTQCIVTGWGKQVLQVHIPNSIMHTLDMSLIPPTQCQAQISQNYPHLLEQYNSNTCVCGQPSNVRANVCKVDIGSALACTNGDGYYYMEGVYSWDSGCTSQNQIASFFKFDMAWYEGTMEAVSSQSQIHETYQNQHLAPQAQAQVQAQASNNKSYAVSGQQAFQQAVGHVHTGPQCHCLENGKK